MRILSRSAALVALASLPTAINAVSLSDMLPRAENLPSDCDKIYESQISGCGVSDFTSRSCTDTCVKALAAMVGPIKTACGNQGIEGSNLIVAFLANVGPQQICPDADIGSYGSMGSSPASTPSPTPSPSPTTAQSTAETTETSSTSSEIESTSLLVDTSSETRTTRTRTPAFSGTTTAGTLTDASSTARSTTASAASSRTTDDAASNMPTQLAANDGSGGGSPFDEEGNMYSESGAESLSSTSVLVSLGIAVLIVVFLFR